MLRTNQNNNPTNHLDFTEQIINPTVADSNQDMLLNPVDPKTTVDFSVGKSSDEITSKSDLERSNHENLSAEDHSDMLKTSLSTVNLSESKNEPDSGSFDGSTLLSNNSETIEEVTGEVSDSYPHVVMSVEELSTVKSLKHWTNPYVRVIGKIKYDDNSNTFILISIGECEDERPSELNLDIGNVDINPRIGSIVEVFASLYLKKKIILSISAQNTTENVQLYLKVRFFRNMDNVDIILYNRALAHVMPYVPLFIKRS